MDEAAESFLRYIRPLQKRLFLVARQYVGRGEESRDLVQETLLRAFRSYSPTEEETYRRAWLFVIMRNVVLDWQRAASRRIKLVPITESELTEIASPDSTEPFCPLPAMDEERFREFLDHRIAAALDALAPNFREVVILAVAGDLNYREIARVLDRPMGTVMSRMARARRELREQLAHLARSRGWIKEVRP